MTGWIRHTLTGLIRGELVRGEKGAALIEYTLLAPIIIVLGLGAGEFGRAVQHHHVINKGARDAARYLARVPATCAGAGIGAGSITSGANVTTAKYLAMTGYPAVSTNWILSYWNDLSTVTVTVDCLDNASLAIPFEGLYEGDTYIPSIRVSIAMPYAEIGFLSVLGVGAMTFTAQHTEPYIGE